MKTLKDYTLKQYVKLCDGKINEEECLMSIVRHAKLFNNKVKPEFFTVVLPQSSFVGDGYKEAVDRIIFKDWELRVNDIGYIEIRHKENEATLAFHNNIVEFDCGIIEIEVKDVEHLNNLIDLELTQTTVWSRII